MQQTMRFNDTELDLIKTTFKDNLPLLYTIRKYFLELELDKKEKEALDKTINGDVLKIIRKFFLPEIDGNAPINQIIDLWMTIEIKGKSPEEAEPFIIARTFVIRYLENKLSSLDKKPSEWPDIPFKDLIKEDVDIVSKFINLIVRNSLVFHVEDQINQINILANQNTKDEEKQIEQDSSK